MANSLISSTSFASNGVPSLRKMSWNQTFGSELPSFDPHGKIVLVLPLTNPQLIAPTLYFFSTGKLSLKVLLFVLAMYSLQINGLPSFCKDKISSCRFLGSL